MENIKIIKVRKDLDERTAFELEKYFISKYKKYGIVNLTNGGEGSSGWFDLLSEKEKDKHREISKSFLNKSHTIETKKKMSDSAKGRTWSNEYKEIFSDKAKGRKGYWKDKKLSKEHTEKISKTLKGKYVGKNNPNYGNGEKTYGEKNVNSKPVIVIKDGIIIHEFVNVSRCFEYFNKLEISLSSSKIKQCLKSREPFDSRFIKQKEFYKRYIFMYKENYISKII